MAENPHNSDFLQKIFDQDASEKRQKKENRKEITFKEYIGLVMTDQSIAQSSPARLWELIQSTGVEVIPEKDRWMTHGVEVGYKLFREELYGVDEAIYKAVQHIRVGEAGGSTGKQILALVGPPAAGKSSFVQILIRALENYKKPVYMIKGCPKHEEPLHLLPRKFRKHASVKLEDCIECANSKTPKHIHLGIKIEGDLCPVCRDLLLTKFGGGDLWYNVPLETFSFSIQGRVGIGDFEPSDERSADITILSGRENIAVTALPGGYKDPRAFELGGEIPAGERGIVQAREVFSSDPSVLRVFFSVAEEKQLKIEGSYFPHISVDTTIIGHTNLTVFKQFAGNKKYEGLHDRFNIVRWPYPLRIRDEIRLYKKLIERDSSFVKIKKCHIAPGTLEVAALFAILSRLNQSQMGIDILTKAKIYNGDVALNDLKDKDKRPVDRRELLAEGGSSDDISKVEGMFGVSSRTILAALNNALVKEPQGTGCLTPTKAIVALRDGFDQRMGFSPEEINRYRDLLSSGEGGSVIVEYREFIIHAVEKAFLKGYEDLAKEIFKKYIEDIELDRSLKRKFVRGSSDIDRDNLTGKPKEPNKKNMRSVEEHLDPPVSESEADVFRGEILELKSGRPDFGFDTYRPLRLAVQKKLLHDSKATLRLVLSPDKPRGEEEKRRADDLFAHMTKDGFCSICAKEYIDKAAEFLNE